MNRTIVICPGIHSPQLTISFVQGMGQVLTSENYLILPTEIYFPYDGIAIATWLKQYYPQPRQAPPLSWIAFSAGVVGAMAAALLWQRQAGKIQSLIAFDGWGMPLVADFPIYRVSHDYFTHWSSGFLGAGDRGFYADPEVTHLDLWRSPESCQGWRVVSSSCQIRSTLPNYLAILFD